MSRRNTASHFLGLVTPNSRSLTNSQLAELMECSDSETAGSFIVEVSDDRSEAIDQFDGDESCKDKGNVGDKDEATSMVPYDNNENESSDWDEHNEEWTAGSPLMVSSPSDSDSNEDGEIRIMKSSSVFQAKGKFRKRKAMDSGTPGTVRPGDTGASTSQSSKTGRPKAIVRDSFVKKLVNGKKLNLCKLCKTHVSDKADRMLKHLEKCPQSIELVVPKSSNDVPESANELKNEVRKIKQPKITEMIQLMDKQLQEKAAIQLARFIYSGCLPFHVVENEEFKKFVHLLNPAFIIPSHDVIGGTLLDKVYKSITEERQTMLQNKACVILQDGWSTNQNDPVISHCLYTPEGTHFFTAKNVGAETKSAEFCYDLMEEDAKKAETEMGVKILGLVTDNCSTMQSLHSIVKQKNPDMEAYGCHAHLFNLLGKKYMPTAVTKQVIQVQKYFRNHHKPAGLLKEKKGKRPIIPNATRWNSEIDCLQNYCENQYLYLEICRKLEFKEKKDREEKETIQKIVDDTQIYNLLQDLIAVLRPIAVALDKVQRKDANLADAVSGWISLMSCLPDEITRNEYFLKQRRIAMTPLAVSAYLLDSRYRGLDIDDDDCDKALSWLEHKNPFYLTLIPEMKKLESTYFFKSYLNSNIMVSMNPRDWWMAAAKQGVSEKMKSEICEILSFPAGTGNIERAFSTMGALITKQRNRLSVDKASKMCTIINHFKIKYKD